MPNIHKKIRAVRVLCRLSQSEAAQNAFISYRTYQRIESGDASPSADQLERIAAAFGCSVSDLYSFDASNNDLIPLEDKKLVLEKENAQLREEIGHLRRTLEVLSNLLPDFLKRGGGGRDDEI